MERLSSLDAGFLDLENDRQQMHVGSLLLFEGPVPSFEEFTARESQDFWVETRSVLPEWDDMIDEFNAAVSA